MKATSSRVVVLLALLLGTAGTFVDPPWSLWLGGMALSVVVLLPLGLWINRWFSRDTARRLRLNLGENELEIGELTPQQRDALEALLNRTGSANKTMRRRASRTAPAPRRLRAFRPQEQAMRAAFVPTSDSPDEAETLAERIAARMKWDALWWFLAALAASIPIGIFVNHIS